MNSCAILMGALAAALATPAQGDISTDAQKRVSQAVAAYPLDAERARRELQAIKGPAVAQLVQVLWCRDDITTPGRLYFVAVIAGIDGPEARLGLVRLLSHWDPTVRGESAAFLGRSHAKDALPALLSLLDDEAVYLTRRSTDPPAEESVFVRDKVVEALEEITGRVLDRGRSPREKARAWRVWLEDRLR